MITVPTTERVAQTMDDCKLSCQNRYSNIPRMDECHSYCEKKKKIHYFKGRMVAIRVVK